MPYNNSGRFLCPYKYANPEGYAKLALDMNVVVISALVIVAIGLPICFLNI